MMEKARLYILAYMFAYKVAVLINATLYYMLKEKNLRAYVPLVYGRKLLNSKKKLNEFFIF